MVSTEYLVSTDYNQIKVNALTSSAI